YLFRDEGSGYALAMIDLKDASRDDLIRLVVAQHETIQRQERVIVAQQERMVALEASVAALTQRVGELLAQVATLQAERERDGTGRPQGMPGLKPAPAKERPPKQSRKRREQAFVRRRMEPTCQMLHALDHCPQCGGPLAGGSVKRRREVIEVPLIPAVVTEHLFVERCCPHCRTRHTPAVDLAGEVVGKQRFGIGLVSLIATLREEARLPVATIQWYLKTFHALCVSGGAIIDVLHQVAAHGARIMATIQEEIRGSPVAHMDETGWREDGVNGYLWTCCTPTARYFARGSRGGAMVDALLGEDFAGVLVSDFYVGYQHYPGVKQKCWAHLLRDVHDLRVAHPDDAAVVAWAAGVHDVYARAVAWKQTHAAADTGARQEASDRFTAELRAIYVPCIAAQVPQRTLSARMAKHLNELFVFVREPAVPPDNNEAERALRHPVTSRKISGGTRSAAGSATKMVLASLGGTWRARGENPYTACRALLTSPYP
ncbi:MAG: IS66 family transposase, partial [Thermomicrobia bacterium]|nr:IS66 family transposase [Thermomicrobia bacterium]MCA1722723.1 IS66 family transposase [Thermomicrobia bacterium]